MDFHGNSSSEPVLKSGSRWLRTPNMAFRVSGKNPCTFGKSLGKSEKNLLFTISCSAAVEISMPLADSNRMIYNFAIFGRGTYFPCIFLIHFLKKTCTLHNTEQEDRCTLDIQDQAVEVSQNL